MTKFMDFSKNQMMVFAFVMVSNFILYSKDESECMDYAQTGYSLTFRDWHLIQGIFLVILIFSNMFLMATTVRTTLGL